MVCGGSLFSGGINVTQMANAWKRISKVAVLISVFPYGLDYGLPCIYVRALRWQRKAAYKPSNMDIQNNNIPLADGARDGSSNRTLTQMARTLITAPREIPELDPVRQEQILVQEYQQARETGVVTRLLRSTLPEVTNSAQMIEGALPRFLPKIEKILDGVELVQAGTTDMLKIYAELGEAIKDLIAGTKFAVWLDKMILAGILVLDAVIAWLKGAVESLPSLIYRALSMLGVTAAVITAMTVRWQGARSTESQQDGINATAESVDLFGFIGLLTGTAILGAVPNPLQLRYISDRFRLFSVASSAFKSIAEAVCYIVQHMPDYVQEWIKMLTPISWWEDWLSPGRELHRWIQRVDLLKGADIRKRASYETALQLEIDVVYHQGRTLFEKLLPVAPNATTVLGIMRPHITRIEELWNIVDIGRSMRGSRPEPFVIYLYGNPGQGKSFLATLLPGVLAEMPADTPNLAWTRNPTVQHWDGYSEQFAVVWDDFFATRDVNTGPGECSEVISAVSNTQYNLPMAALGDKGAVFKSPLIIITSNTPYPRPNNMNTVEAFYRRRHMLVEVEADAGVRIGGNGQIDVDRLPADGTSHLRFRLRDSVDERINPGPQIDFDAFINTAKERFVAHRAQQMNAMQRSRDLVAATLQRLNPPEEQPPDVFQVENAEQAINAQPEGLFDDLYAMASVPEVPVADAVWTETQNVLKEHTHERAGFFKPFLPIISVVCAAGALYYVYKRVTKTKGEHNANTEALDTLSKKACQDIGRSIAPNYKITRLQHVKALADRAEKQRKWATASILRRYAEASPEVRAQGNELPETLDNLSDESLKSLCAFMSELDGKEYKTKEDLTSSGDIARMQGLALSALSVTAVAEGAYGNFDKLSARKTQYKNKTQPKVYKPNADKEACSDDNGYELATGQIMANVCLLSVGPQTSNGLFVGGRTVLAPYHCFVGADAKLSYANVTVKTATTTFTEAFVETRMKRIQTDAVLYTFGKTCPPKVNITKHFLKDNNIRHVGNSEALLVAISARSFSNYLQTLEVTPSYERMSYAFGEDPLGEGNTIDEYEGWQYQTPTLKGMCGAPIVALNTRLPQKILGIHICGSDMQNIGTALVITQEMIGQIDGVNAAPQSLFRNVKKGIEAVKILPEGNFTILGTYDRTLYQNTETKIRPSMIQKQLGQPLTQPAALSTHDCRVKVPGSLLKRGIEKYGSCVPVLPTGILQQALESVALEVAGWNSRVDRRILTIEEALNGDPLNPYMDPIQLDTSSGIPWKLEEGANGKKHLIGGEPLQITSEKLMDAIILRESFAKKNMRYPSLWMDCLKDERRPLKKIEEGKTRVFTIPPVDYTILARKYLLPFAAHLYENAGRTFSAPGLTTMSLQWHHMYMRLAKISNVGFSVDYSNWDGSLHPEVIEGIGEVVKRFYPNLTEEQGRVIDVLFNEMAHTNQVAINVVYQTHCGNPSGNPITAPLNTLIGSVYMRMAFLTLAPIPQRTLAVYKDHVGETIYGDDGAFTVSAELRGYFHPTAISAVLKEWGLTMTPATKDGSSVQWQPLKELTFLKNGFREDDYGRMVPTYPLELAKELARWIRLNDVITKEDQTIVNINESLRFAFHHGKREFEKLRSEFLEALPAKYRSRVNRYEYYHTWFYETPELNAHPESNSMGIIDTQMRGLESQGLPKMGDGMAKESQIDAAWNLQSMVSRRAWENTYTWTTSLPRWHVFGRYTTPGDLIVNYLQAAPFERFLYWRGGTKIHVHVNGTRFHAGRLQIFWVPFTRKEVTPGWHEQQHAAAWTVPCVFVDVATSNEAILDIPFENPKNYITLNSTYDDAMDFTGTLVIQVLSPLAAASGVSPSVDFNVWVEFDDTQEFHVPLYTKQATRAFNKEHQAITRIKRNAHPEGNTITTNQRIENYGKINSMALPNEITGDSVGNGNDVQASLPMDKPAWTLNPLAIFRRGLQTFNNTIGTESLVRMDLNPSNQTLSTSEHFSTDEMAMEKLFRKETYAGQAYWNQTMTAGTEIMGGFIGPMSGAFQAGKQEVLPAVSGIGPWNPTLWEYNAMPYTYWRGSVKLRFDFVASQMHVGRLFLSIHYGAAPDDERSLKDVTSQYGVEVELSPDQRTFAFQIPYVAATPWLRICHGPQVGDPLWYLPYFTGSWSLRVLNQLVVPDNVSPNVDIIVSTSGGDDFEVYYPGAQNNFHPFLIAHTLQIPRNAKKESDEKTEEIAIPGPGDAAEVITIAPTPAKPRKSYHFGPRAVITHLGDVIKRYFAVHDPDITTKLTEKANNCGYFIDAASHTLIGYYAIPVAPIRADAYSPISGQRNMFRPLNEHSPLVWHGLQYRFYRGTIRYRLLFGKITDDTREYTPSFYGCALLPNPTQFADQEGVTGIGTFDIVRRYAQQLLNQTRTSTPKEYLDGSVNVACEYTTSHAPYLEVEVPFLSHYNKLPTMHAYTAHPQRAYDNTTATLMAYWAVPFFDEAGLKRGGIRANLNVFMAAGDDFRYGGLLGPPVLGGASSRIDNSYLYYYPDKWSYTAPVPPRSDVVPPVVSSLVPGYHAVHSRGWAPSPHIPVAPAQTAAQDERITQLTHTIHHLRERIRTRQGDIPSLEADLKVAQTEYDRLLGGRPKRSIDSDEFVHVAQAEGWFTEWMPCIPRWLKDYKPNTYSTKMMREAVMELHRVYDGTLDSIVTCYPRIPVRFDIKIAPARMVENNIRISGAWYFPDDDVEPLSSLLTPVVAATLPLGQRQISQQFVATFVHRITAEIAKVEGLAIDGNCGHCGAMLTLNARPESSYEAYLQLGDAVGHTRDTIMETEYDVNTFNRLLETVKGMVKGEVEIWWRYGECHVHIYDSIGGICVTGVSRSGERNGKAGKQAAAIVTAISQLQSAYYKLSFGLEWQNTECPHHQKHGTPIQRNAHPESLATQMARTLVTTESWADVAGEALPAARNAPPQEWEWIPHLEKFRCVDQVMTGSQAISVLNEFAVSNEIDLLYTLGDLDEHGFFTCTGRIDEIGYESLTMHARSKKLVKQRTAVKMLRDLLCTFEVWAIAYGLKGPTREQAHVAPGVDEESGCPLTTSRDEIVRLIRSVKYIGDLRKEAKLARSLLAHGYGELSVSHSGTLLKSMGVVVALRGTKEYVEQQEVAMADDDSFVDVLLETTRVLLRVLVEEIDSCLDTPARDEDIAAASGAPTSVEGQRSGVGRGRGRTSKD